MGVRQAARCTQKWHAAYLILLSHPFSFFFLCICNRADRYFILFSFKNAQSGGGSERQDPKLQKDLAEVTGAAIKVVEVREFTSSVLYLWELGFSKKVLHGGKGQARALPASPVLPHL